MLLEDDHYLAEHVVQTLDHSFSGVRVDRVTTESEFLEWVTNVQEPPDIFVLDLVVPWGKHSPIVSSANEEESSPMSAGIRCLEYLTENQSTSDTPVILYSAHFTTEIASSASRISNKVTFVAKHESPGKLVTTIRELLREKKQEVAKRVILVGDREGVFAQQVKAFLDGAMVPWLHVAESPSAGATIIERLERESESAFAIALLTLGVSEPDSEGLRHASQNSVFELGFFAGKLGRRNLVVMYDGGVELPSDIIGLTYIPTDGSGSWKIRLLQELKVAGFEL